MNILFFKKHKTLTAVFSIFTVFLIFAVYYFLKPKTPQYNLIIAKKTDLIQEVSVTGNVKPAQNVDLAFEKSGKINKINVAVGDKVYAGEILVSLDSNELNAQLLQDQASVLSQEAKLDALKFGTRPEEIKVAQSNLDKSKQDLSNLYSGVSDVLNSAYADADDAVRIKIDALFTNDESVNPLLTFQMSNSQLEIDFKYLRFLASDSLNSWKNELNSLNGATSFSQLDAEIKKSESHIAVIKNFLAKGIEAMDYTVNLSSATIDSYKNDLNAARDNVNAAIESINNKEQSILSQKAVVGQNQDELNLKLAGSIPQDIAAQEALVDQARAKVELTKAQIEKNDLRSPIKGVITKQDFKVGEIAQANEALISAISSDNYEIDANIAEADIAKIKIGNTAKLTLDAYGNDVVFSAKVVSIDPAETVIEGVSTYKTVLHFTNEDGRIKSGMTANIDILTNEKKNVITIPQRAVFTKGSDKFVEILIGGAVEDIKIETGIAGSDGNIEIIKGINEDDKVVVSKK